MQTILCEGNQIIRFAVLKSLGLAECRFENSFFNCIIDAAAVYASSSITFAPTHFKGLRRFSSRRKRSWICAIKK